MSNEKVDLSNFAKNLRYYRKLYGETFETLYDLLDISPSTLSAYEKDKIKPGADALIKLSKHYLVPAELLFERKLWDSEKFSMDHDNRKIMRKSGMMIFAMFEPSESAKKDVLFQKAYEAHRRVYDAMAGKARMDIQDVQKSITYYIKSAEENFMPDTIANLLWLYVQLKISHVYRFQLEKMSEYEWFSKYKSVDKKVFIPKYMLHNELSDEERFEDKLDKEWEQMKKLFYEHCDECIALLKGYEQTSDFADYYVALQYMLNLEDNDLGAVLNCTIGTELMKKLVKFENKYAIDFKEAMRESIE